MTNKQRCYESLNTLSDGLLCSWIAGSYRRHLPTAGAIVEIEVVNYTCLRIKDDSDSDSDQRTRATIVEYQVNHQTREAEPIYQWTASKVSLGENRKHTKGLERLVGWLNDEVVKKIPSPMNIEG